MHDKEAMLETGKPEQDVDCAACVWPRYELATQGQLYKRLKKANKYMLSFCSKYLGPSRAKYLEKGRAASKIGEG